VKRAQKLRVSLRLIREELKMTDNVTNATEDDNFGNIYIPVGISTASDKFLQAFFYFLKTCKCVVSTKHALIQLPFRGISWSWSLIGKQNIIVEILT
jgi:hypothetical protein